MPLVTLKKLVMADHWIEKFQLKLSGAIIKVPMNWKLFLFSFKVCL